MGGVYANADSSRIPPPPGEDELPLHTRTYDVRSYRIDASTLRVRGRVTDTKPPGLYVRDDPDPLDVHDMVVDLVIDYPSFTVNRVEVVFESHPHTSCLDIEPAYEALVGESIARGFSRRVTELFGGPRGCTHVGALLRAMAPVAVQSIYSMRLAETEGPVEEQSEEERLRARAFTIDSCHVWAADGAWVRALEEGSPVEVPVWLERRLRDLDRLDEAENWMRL
jgi:hypothetical protein